MMINIIGQMPEVSPLLEVAGAHVHVYGKQPRPSRKLGHVTIVADNEQQLADRAASVERVLTTTVSGDV